ncbi:hypothetical protein [Pseudomonas sp. SCB32]|uniref:hypothetical protein n=1 Tax=Pseudomonas sp. SCB32 TaxID=2653853 RepID=UPI003556C877
MPANTTSGTVLESFTSSGEVSGSYNCTGSSGTAYLQIASSPYPLTSNGIYSTSVPGIGVRVVRATSGATLPISAQYSNAFGVIPAPFIRYEFVKIGPIVSGTISSAGLPNAWYIFDNSSNIFFVRYCRGV